MGKTIRLKLPSLLVIIASAFFLLLYWYQRGVTNGNETLNQIGSHNDEIRKDNMLFKASGTRLSNEVTCNTIHICIVCVGSDAIREVITLMKSLLFYRKRPLHVHFIVNDTSKLVLSHLFRTWDISDFTVSFYFMDNYVKKVSWIPNTHYSGIFGLIKLLIPSILPSYVIKVIALDTDLLFVADISELWDFFDTFTDSNSIGLVENQSEWYLRKMWKNYAPWPAIGQGFNTGVMLLDCKKLRLTDWSSRWETLTRQTLISMPSVQLADQDVINSCLKSHPTMVKIVPCFWNFQLCEHMKKEFCYSQHHHEIKAIHWNSESRSKYTLVTNMNIMYQTFKEMNGALLRSPSSCNKQISTDDDENDELTQVDPCSEFVNSATRLHRTHLYFLPFDYSPEENDVSIVVQLSVDRFTMLEKLCEFWSGPISVALFISDADTERIHNLIKLSTSLNKRKNVAYHLVYQNTIDEIYPINLLRNIALNHAVTDYVLLYDVDFVPMPGLYEYIVSHLESIGNSDKTALIIPAYESLWYKFEMPHTKSELLEQVNKGMITTFRSYLWPQGHAATNFSFWRSAQKPYKVNWEPDFEPYVVVRKAECPSYDDRFIGFGWNKVSHIIELDAAGFTFNVMPFGFMIHLPHSPSIDLVKYRSQLSYRKCIELAKLDFLDYLRQKYGDISSKYVDIYKSS
ncbi:unnamed protein product [Clavelina lepadiformis]|uniref:Uncharacterized protein n=1 Tax=Clavelina lepadiformis TaxID=159417 RepID=A0ABP0G2V7_CLALP